MAPGIGVDMVEVARIARAIEKGGFKDRVFTPAEQAYCDSRGVQSTQSYAARFAGKEAILKSFGTGLRGGKLTEIVISLSHDKTYAIAQAMAWRDAK